MSNKQPLSYPLRLEPELKQWIKGRAKDGDRSVNAEINRTLRKAKESEEGEEQKDKDA